MVWLPFYIFPYIGFLIIPTDFHIFQRGGPTTNQDTSWLSMAIGFWMMFFCHGKFDKAWSVTWLRHFRTIFGEKSWKIWGWVMAMITASYFLHTNESPFLKKKEIPGVSPWLSALVDPFQSLRTRDPRPLKSSPLRHSSQSLERCWPCREGNGSSSQWRFHGGFMGVSCGFHMIYMI